MALHEKKLDFKSHIVMITKGEQYQPWYLQINPRGEVPVLKDGVKIIPDSSRIIDYLDDNFSNGNSPRLIPSDQGSEIKQRVIHFRNILDQIPVGILTMGSFYNPEFCQNPKPPFIKPVRKMLMDADRSSFQKLIVLAANNPEHAEILRQKAEFQELKHKTVTSKTEYNKVLEQVDKVLREVENELQSHETAGNPNWWLCCEQFTVADISLAVLLERLRCLGLENRFWVNGKPHIVNYFQRLQQRHSFTVAIPSGLSNLKEVIKIAYPLTLVMGTVTAAVAAIVVFLYLRRRK